MKKNLYKGPVRKKKEILFYLCRIGSSEINIIISSAEVQYWRIKDKLQDFVDVGCFDAVFPKGTVFCERIDRTDAATLTKEKKAQIIKRIKRNFHAISFEELIEVIRTPNTLEKFMTDSYSSNFDDGTELKKILPLKEISRAEYFYHAVSSRFPEFAKKLQKEHKTLAEEMEIE